MSTLKTKRNIFLVILKTEYRLAATFLRFQEHYESSKFRGRIFTLEEFMDWYAEENGKFSYFEDWGGFNIPSRALQPFYAGKFNPLIKKEKAFLNLFKDIDDKFYVIGVSEQTGVNIVTLRHEFVHGLFYTVPQYRREVLRQTRKHRARLMRAWLKKKGYHQKVMDDEINAYLVTSPKLPVSKDKGLRELRARLQDIFNEQFGFDIEKASKDSILEQIYELRL